MANTKSAKKAIRSSKAKKIHNTMWEKKVKDNIKELKNLLDSKPESAVLTKQLTVLQKSVDKAAKEKAIHKNKANRVKSIYAKRVSALLQKESAPKRSTGRRAK
jgi:ribosomal protein S20